MQLPNESERFFARAMGEAILHFVRDLDLQHMTQQANSDALSLIKVIREILDDQTLDDPECFQRIDAIVQAFSRYDLPTTRHSEIY